MGCFIKPIGNVKQWSISDTFCCMNVNNCLRDAAKYICVARIQSLKPFSVPWHLLHDYLLVEQLSRRTVFQAINRLWRFKIYRFHISVLCLSHHICSTSSTPSAFYFKQSLNSKDRNNQGKTNCLLSSQLNTLAIICRPGYFFLEKLLDYIYICSLLCKKNCSIPTVRLDLSTPVYFVYSKMLSIRMPMFCVPNCLL